MAHECATLPHLFLVSPTGLKRNHSVQATSTKSSQSLWSDEAILQGNCLACCLCSNCSTVKIQGGLDTRLLLLWWQLWWCLNIWMAQRWRHNTLIQQARNAGFSMPLLINHLIIHPWSIAPISSGRWGTSLAHLFSSNSNYHNFKSCHGLLWTSAFLYTVFLADIELLIYEDFLSPANLHNYTKKFHVK